MGRRLIELLIEKNHDVIAPLREDSCLNDLVNPDRFHPIQWSGAQTHLPFSNIDVVVHCAAVHPATGKDFSTNVRLTELALDFSKRLKAKQFILISSVAVYGDLYEGERNDEAAIQPDGPYGKSKRESEELVVAFCRRENIKYTLFRPGMIYGPYDRGLILKLIRLIDSGFCIRFGAGKNKRSLVSNETIARIVLFSLLNETLYQDTFIIAGKPPHSVNHIIDEISEVLGKRPFLLAIPNWVLHTFGAFLTLLNRLGIRTPVTWFDLKKLMCNATYDPDKLEKRVGPVLEENFRVLLQQEIDWYRISKRTADRDLRNDEGRPLSPRAPASKNC